MQDHSNPLLTCHSNQLLTHSLTISKKIERPRRSLRSLWGLIKKMVVANNFVVGFSHGIAQPLVFLMLCKISDFSALWRKSETLWAHDTITGVHTGESHLSHRHCGAKVHCDDSPLRQMKQKIISNSCFFFLNDFSQIVLALMCIGSAYILLATSDLLVVSLCWSRFSKGRGMKTTTWRQVMSRAACGIFPKRGKSPRRRADNQNIGSVKTFSLSCSSALSCRQDTYTSSLVIWTLPWKEGQDYASCHKFGR